MSRVRDAFESVHASQELIDSTKQRMSELRKDDQQKVSVREPRKVRRLAMVCAVLLCILLVGSYNASVSACSYISIDASPSIELSLNKNGKVVDAEAYNDSGQAVLESVDIKHMNYVEAMDVILASDAMTSGMEDDGTLKLTVMSDDLKRAGNIEEGLEGCHGVRAHSAKTQIADTDVSDAAHENGMSFGKYMAYLTLKEYDDTISAEHCHSMTMGEIERSIEEHSEHGGHEHEGKHHH